MRATIMHSIELYVLFSRSCFPDLIHRKKFKLHKSEWRYYLLLISKHYSKFVVYFSHASLPEKSRAAYPRFWYYPGMGGERMNILRQLDDAVAYIEANLCDELDMGELARITCVTADSFTRFFGYMCGVTLKEYIRRRRLTLAAYELRNSDIKVIDVALKYGYNSADAFAKAFSRQHGVTPTQARDPHQPLRVYPPVSFHITIKGAREMNFKIINTETIKLRGLSKEFHANAANRFGEESIMWADESDEYTQKIDPNNTDTGIWYGVWDSGNYWIARAEGEADTSCTHPCEIPGGTYAVFTTGCGNVAGAELPKLREQIFDAWLPDSGYVQTQDYEVEVYHCFPKQERAKRYYEIWIPVKKAL